MNFARAEYLHLFWGLPILAAFLIWSLRVRRRKLEAFVSPSLVPPLTREFSRRKTVLRACLLLCFVAFGILALARPQWGARMETVRRRGVDIIVALDTSYSMNAEDVAPSRLMKAKNSIRSLIDRLRGDRIGIVTFAGTAVVQCPLTLDYGAAHLFLDVINTEIIPEPGTSLAAAIQSATSAFSAKERKYKVLIIFTDGEDLEGEVESALQKAKESGVILYTVGIGTPEGRPIPIRDENGLVVEYRKDENGNVVVSRLDERTLAQIALETGGRYYRATTSEGELDAMYEEVSGLEKKELESTVFQNFEDRFQYPLVLAVLCLILEIWIGERRRPGRSILERIYKNTDMVKAASLAWILVLSAPAAYGDSSAASKNRDGNRLFHEGKYVDAEKAYLEAQAQAPDRPEPLYNLGNALLKQKKYPQAVETLSRAASRGAKGLQANSWYNSGNAFFEMRDYSQAVNAFTQALRLNPADRDAKHNLELALRMIEEQKQQAQKPQSQEQQNQNRDQQAGNQQQPPQSEKKDEQAQSPPQKPEGDKTGSPQATQANRKNESFSKERALQILDALQNQELAEQRKLLESRARRKATGRDW